MIFFRGVLSIGFNFFFFGVFCVDEDIGDRNIDDKYYREERGNIKWSGCCKIWRNLIEGRRI